jgi:hypothetical protein
MGLDGVELVMKLEEAFGLAIPDEAAQEMITPRQTIDYIESRLVTARATHCLTQRVFYDLRRAIRSRLGQDLAVRPGTKLSEIDNKRDWPDLWSRVRETVGTSDWPERIPWKGWIVANSETLRELTMHIAMHLPPPDPTRGEPWTRERIELTVRWAVWDVIGVKGFALDDQYARDMGVD